MDLCDLLQNLEQAVDAYRESVNKAHLLFFDQIEQVRRDQAELRDELHEQATALGNRIESLTRSRGAA